MNKKKKYLVSVALIALFLLLGFWIRSSGVGGVLYEYALEEQKKTLSDGMGSCINLKNGWAVLDFDKNTNDVVIGVLGHPLSNREVMVLNPFRLKDVLHGLEPIKENNLFFIYKKLAQPYRFYLKPKKNNFLFSHENSEKLEGFYTDNVLESGEC